MLVLTRKAAQDLIIQFGEERVVLRVVAVNAKQVRLGITAAPSVRIHRAELPARSQAGTAAPPGMAGASVPEGGPGTRDADTPGAGS